MPHCRVPPWTPIPVAVVVAGHRHRGVGALASSLGALWCRMVGLGPWPVARAGRRRRAKASWGCWALAALAHRIGRRLAGRPSATPDDRGLPFPPASGRQPPGRLAARTRKPSHSNEEHVPPMDRIWSEVVLARGKTEVFGKAMVQYAEVKNQSNCSKRGASYMLLQEKLRPYRDDL
ncbi:hypothetical protein U9M48_012915 [Paspalum notatum var. saurae]|uniref:Uncharacterized protein n=1 Tax=Paspalum notatum var. saurae TaxID=547442 RepID=A0AAQ3SYN2_PASNO